MNLCSVCGRILVLVCTLKHYVVVKCAYKYSDPICDYFLEHGEFLKEAQPRCAPKKVPVDLLHRPCFFLRGGELGRSDNSPNSGYGDPYLWAGNSRELTPWWSLLKKLPPGINNSRELTTGG